MVRPLQGRDPYSLQLASVGSAALHLRLITVLPFGQRMRRRPPTRLSWRSIGRWPGLSSYVLSGLKMEKLQRRALSPAVAIWQVRLSSSVGAREIADYGKPGERVVDHPCVVRALPGKIDAMPGKRSFERSISRCKGRRSVGASLQQE